MRTVSALLLAIWVGIGCSSSSDNDAPPGAPLYGPCVTGNDCASALCLGLASGFVCTKECSTNAECSSATSTGQTNGECTEYSGGQYCLPPGSGDAGHDAGSDAGADASSTGGAGGSGGSGGTGGSGANGGSGGSGGTPCNPPLGGECDVIPQCGCSVGEKCALTDISTNVTTGCVPAGSAQPQGTCNTGGGCSAGHECFNGVCTPFCNVDSDCPGHENGSQCVPAVVYGETVPGIYVCAAACNPLTSSGCGPGAACSFVFTGGEIVSRCQQEGTKSVYSSCTSWFDCKSGSWCAGGFCLEWCRIGMNDCPGSTTCYEYTIQGNPIVYQGQTWGACG